MQSTGGMEIRLDFFLHVIIIKAGGAQVRIKAKVMFSLC